METKTTIRSSSFKSKLENLLPSPEIDLEKSNYAASKSELSRKMSLKNSISFSFNEPSVRFVTN